MSAQPAACRAQNSVWDSFNHKTDGSQGCTGSQTVPYPKEMSSMQV